MKADFLKMQLMRFVTFFCNKQEQEIVSKLGFECVGEYVCYKRQLI